MLAIPYSMIQSGGRFGMQTMSQSLAELSRTGKIAKEEALNRAPLAEDVVALLGGAAAVSPAGNTDGGRLAGARRLSF